MATRFLLLELFSPIIHKVSHAGEKHFSCCGSTPTAFRPTFKLWDNSQTETSSLLGFGIKLYQRIAFLNANIGNKLLYLIFIIAAANH